VARLGGKRNAYRISVDEPLEKYPHARPRKMENNKNTNLTETGMGS
jgi:hypothetical protein